MLRELQPTMNNLIQFYCCMCACLCVSVCMCVYTCICVCVCVCTHACVCTQSWCVYVCVCVKVLMHFCEGQRRVWSVIPQKLFTSSFSFQCLSLTCISPYNYAGRPVSPEICHLSLSTALSVCHIIWLFLCVSRVANLVFVCETHRLLTEPTFQVYQALFFISFSPKIFGNM